MTYEPHRHHMYFLVSLDGKQFQAVSEFEYLYRPVSVSRFNLTVIEAFILLKSKRLSGIAVLNDTDEMVSSLRYAMPLFYLL